MSSFVNLDEVVVLGVGIYVGVLNGRVKDVLLFDIIFYFLGIEILGGVVIKII